MRHTFVSMPVAVGVDGTTIGRYAQVLEAHAKEAMERFDAYPAGEVVAD